MHRLHESRGVPVDLHRSHGQVAPPEVFHAPGARLRVDEGRPEPKQVGEPARARVEFEFERGRIGEPVRLGGQCGVQVGTVYGEAIDDEAGLGGKIASFKDGVVDRHGQFARAFAGEDGILRLKVAAPCVFLFGGRREPAGDAEMAGARERLDVVETEPLRAGVPGHVARGLVDEERFVIGIGEFEITRAETEPALHRRNRGVLRQAHVEFERDRHVGLEGRPARLQQQKVVEAEIVRLHAEAGLRAAARVRGQAPQPRGSARRGLDRGRVVASVERYRKVFVDRFLVERFVFDLEMAMRQRDVIQRLARTGHRIDQTERQESRIAVRGVARRCRIRGRRGQFDRRRVGRARRGDRERAVRPHPQFEDEAVQFESPHLHVQREQRDDVQTDPAAGGGDDRPTLAVADLNAAESQADAAGAAHQEGRADRHAIARAEPLLQAAGQAWLQALQTDRAGGEQIEKGAAQRDPERHDESARADRSPCDPACAQR